MALGGARLLKNKLDLGCLIHDLGADDDCSILEGMALAAEHIFRGGMPASMVTRA